ncbi:hypothetical protein SNEBB_005543 [Seison nebaliae]|nr:hypothetical protein SNEBB_005543 [Seison nebaliae]
MSFDNVQFREEHFDDYCQINENCSDNFIPMPDINSSIYKDVRYADLPSRLDTLTSDESKDCYVGLGGLDINEKSPNSGGESISCEQLDKSISDKGNETQLKKPQKSYIYLIQEAILGNPDKRATLSDIYNNIESKYPFYQEKKERWQNSVRHSLSFNDCFIRIPRKETESGKGAYWGVHPEVASDFSQERFLRRVKRFVDPKKNREKTKEKNGKPKDGKPKKPVVKKIGNGKIKKSKKKPNKKNYENNQLIIGPYDGSTPDSICNMNNQLPLLNGDMDDDMMESQLNNTHIPIYNEHQGTLIHNNLDGTYIQYQPSAPILPPQQEQEEQQQVQLTQYPPENMGDYPFYHHHQLYMNCQVQQSNCNPLEYRQIFSNAEDTQTSTSNYFPNANYFQNSSVTNQIENDSFNTENLTNENILLPPNEEIFNDNNELNLQMDQQSHHIPAALGNPMNYLSYDMGSDFEGDSRICENDLNKHHYSLPYSFDNMTSQAIQFHMNSEMTIPSLFEQEQFINSGI